MFNWEIHSKKYLTKQKFNSLCLDPTCLRKKVFTHRESYLECLEGAGVEESCLLIAVSCDIVETPSPDMVEASESILAVEPAPLTKPVIHIL